MKHILGVFFSLHRG